MGFIRRNGRANYIRSISRRARVTFDYVGTGELAYAIALLDRDFRAINRLERMQIEADRAERARIRALRERLEKEGNLEAEEVAGVARS